MGHREAIYSFILRYPGRNDDEIAAALQIKPRQTVNLICRALTKSGQIDRRRGQSGKICNFPKSISQGSDMQANAPVVARRANSALAPAIEEWFWEGNVVNALAQCLEARGWKVKFKADTASKQRGVDLRVHRNGIELVIEAKGYPSKHYRDPQKAGKIKPTNPSLQAQHWFAHALLKVIQLQASERGAHAVMAFPDCQKYRGLFAQVEPMLNKLEIGVIFVGRNGTIEPIGLEV